MIIVTRFWRPIWTRSGYIAITEKDIKPYNSTICEPKTIEKCEYHWVCENEECYIKRWDKNPDTCKPFTITECKTVLLNQTITRNVEIEKNITIQYCESVPKTKCEIAQVDKTHCTTEVVEVCITNSLTNFFEDSGAFVLALPQFKKD